MENIAGPPVSSNNFSNRERDVAEIWEQLQHHHLLLLAPRRVGKTSLLMRIRDQADAHERAAIYADISGARDELEFIERLHQAMNAHHLGAKLLKSVKDALGSFADRFKKISALGASLELEGKAPPDYRHLGSALLSALDKHETPWLVLLDELPVFLLRLLRDDPSHRRAQEFMFWLRSLRTDEASDTRWVLAGSLGLLTVAERARLSETIDDLHCVRVGPFERDHAETLLLQLAAVCDMGDLDRSVLDHMLDRLQWLVPYHLQLLFKKLRAHASRERPATISAVDAAYRDIIDERQYFVAWRHRLIDSLGEEQGAQAMRLLDQVARGGPDGATTQALRQSEHARDEDLGFLLDILRSDGYLVEKDGRHHFRSPLLRDYWRRRLPP